MYEGARLRTPLIFLFLALLIALSGGSAIGAIPLPVLPVEDSPIGDGAPAEREPDEADPESEPGSSCADGSTAASVLGETFGMVRFVTTADMAVNPQPVLPVETNDQVEIVDSGPPVVECNTELLLKLEIVAPNDEKPEGADATLESGIIPQAALEAGYGATLPSQSRDILFADPGDKWELVETSCICTGSSARSSPRGVQLVSSPAGSAQLASAPAPVIPVEGGSDAIGCGGASAAAPAGLSLGEVSIGELSTYPGPVIPVEGDGSIDLFDEPTTPPATIDWDANGTISIRDPYGAGGVFLCEWTVELVKGRLSIKTTTVPSGEEDRFGYRVTPQFVHEDASPVTLRGTSSPSPMELHHGTWSIESMELPDAWRLKESDCQETQDETPSMAQGTGGTAGIDGSDDVRCAFELKLLTPQAGRWSSQEQAGRFSCPGGAIRIPASSSAARVTVTGDGDQIVGTGISSGGSGSITLRRNRDQPRRYVGKIPFSIQGASGRFDIRIDFSSERRAKGLMTGKIRVKGQTCTLRRAFTIAR